MTRYEVVQKRSKIYTSHNPITSFLVDNKTGKEGETKNEHRLLVFLCDALNELQDTIKELQNVK